MFALRRSAHLTGFCGPERLAISRAPNHQSRVALAIPVCDRVEAAGAPAPPRWMSPRPPMPARSAPLQLVDLAQLLLRHDFTARPAPVGPTHFLPRIITANLQLNPTARFSAPEQSTTTNLLRDSSSLY